VVHWLADERAWALVGAIATALLAVGALVRKAYKAITGAFRTVSRLGDELLGDREKGIPSVRAALDRHIADGHGGQPLPRRTPQRPLPWGPTQ
jgi:hypothetical protein